MKYAKLAVVLMIVSGFILWCRRSVDIGHIARSLPFSGGYRPGIYDIGAIVVLLVLLWGGYRLTNRGRRSDEPADYDDDESDENFDEGYEPDENDEDDDDLYGP